MIETKAKGLFEKTGDVPNNTPVVQPSSTPSSTSVKENKKEESKGGFFNFGKTTTNQSDYKPLNEDEDVVEVKVNEAADVYKGNVGLTKEQRLKHDEIEKELFAEVFSTQKDCLDIIDRLNKKAEETISIASDSAELLKQQREQLIRIDQEMDELGSNVKRARREVTAFIRRIHTDKCCAVMCLLVALAILGGCIFAIVMKFVPININNNNNNKTNSTSVAMPITLEKKLN